MSNPIKLRLIGGDEIEEAYRLETASYTPETAASREAFLFRKAAYADYFWSAWRDGRLVGIANGVLTDRTDCREDDVKSRHLSAEQGRNLCVLTVAVDAVCRREGVGTMLMRRLMETAASNRLDSVFLMCELHLIPLYENLGFEYAGKSASRHGGLEWHEMKWFAGKSFPLFGVQL